MKQSKWLALAFFLSGSSLMFYAYTESQRDLYFLAKGQHAQGKVLGQVYRDGDRLPKNQKRYYPLVSFQYKGKDTLFEADRGATHPAFKTGDRVDVMFFENKPYLAVINSFTVVWLKPLLFALLGLGFLVTAFVHAYRGFLVKD